MCNRKPKDLHFSKTASLETLSIYSDLPVKKLNGFLVGRRLPLQVDQILRLVVKLRSKREFTRALFVVMTIDKLVLTASVLDRQQQVEAFSLRSQSTNKF